MRWGNSASSVALACKVDESFVMMVIVSGKSQTRRWRWWVGKMEVVGGAY